VQGYRLRKHITPAEITGINLEQVVPGRFISSKTGDHSWLNLSTARQLLAEVRVIAPSEITPGFSLRVFVILAGHLGDKSTAPLIEVFVESLWLV
jgi:hypothetical protein